MGHWNVRTLCGTGAVYTFVDQIKRKGVMVCGISETHWTGNGSMTIDDYTIWYSGGEEGGKHEHGVAIATNRKLTGSVTRVVQVNNRIILIRIKSKHANITFIEAYAPTNQADDEEKEQFYSELQEVMETVPRHDVIMLLGDFNAKIGKNHKKWGRTLGPHGIGDENENENGERLLNFCKENDLCVTNSQFIQKHSRKVTWVSPDGTTKNMIDFIITREEWLTSITRTRAYTTPDVNSDHHLLIAEIRIKLSGTRKADTTARYDMAKLEQESKGKEFELKLQNRFQLLANLTDDMESGEEIKTVEEEWSMFKNAMNETAKETLGYRKKEKTCWVKEETRQIMENIGTIKENLAANNGGREMELKEQLRQTRKKLKKKLIEDRTKHYEEIAEDMEDALKRGDSRKLFAKAGNLMGRNYSKAIKLEQVCDQNGKVLTEKDEIIHRWKEHFEQLLNKEEPDGATETLREIEQSDKLCETEEQPDSKIQLEEVRRAVRQMRKGKAPGLCGITAEMLQQTGEVTVKWIHRVVTAVWEIEEIPEDWRKAIIVPLHKKGDKKLCSNSRGISLLSVPGKVFTRIILNRIKQTIEEVLRENQSGFRKGRGCRDHIFLMRQIIEKKREHNEDTYICFIDYAQAYDSVWRRGAWKILEKYGICEKIIRLMTKLYGSVTATVKVEGKESEWFSILTGFRQGCILSPTMFNIVLDYILKRIYDNGKTGEHETPHDVEYADDTSLLEEFLEELIKMTERLADESKKMGLHINIKKTKIMPVTRNYGPWLPQTINREEIDIVDRFVYLGSELMADGTCTNEIKRRIIMAETMFGKMTKVLRRHDVSLKLKIRLLNSCVIPVLTYGAESWTVTKEMEKKLDACEMRWLRRMLRVSYKEHTTNEEIRRRTQQMPINERIRKIRMTWMGHLLRMEDNRIAKQIYQWQPSKKRRRGRPQKRWMDNIEEDLGRAGLTTYGKTSGRRRLTLEEIAKDRGRWREVVAASMAGYSWTMDT